MAAGERLIGKSMKFIFSYLKKYRAVMAVGITIKISGAVGELMLPYVLEHMVDDVVPMESVGLIFLWGGVMILLTIFVRQANVKANRLAIRVAKESIYEIRRDLFWKSVNLSGNQTDEFGLPSLNSRMTSDSYNLQSFIQSMQALGIRAPIMLIGGIVITLTMDVGLASVLCIAAPIMIVAVVFVSMRGIPLYDNVQKSMDGIVRIMRENISGIRVVKALSKEDYEIRRFEEANDRMAGRDRKAGIIMALPGPVMTLILNVGLTAVVFVGAVRVNNGQTQPGVILAFLTYFNMIQMGVMGLNRIFMLMSKANASAKRIAAVVYAQEDLTPVPETEAAVTDRKEYIVFDHVGFSYGKKDENKDVGRDENRQEKPDELSRSRAFGGQERQKCLEDIDFVIPKGGSLGIIGATGCGKTTIINLLMRFYDTDDGHVFIGGKDVRTYDKDKLHRMFGAVFQNDVIFADSLKENISFGRNLKMDEIRSASADAMARDFIERYEDAYEHQAASHGANLSGGQRQRVLIARALAAEPEILILDDSSSALDYRTDALLRKAIREHHRCATTIVIAQRVSSIMGLDDIIMLDEGKIVGHGTHEKLLEDCAMYRDIYKTQMGA